MGILLSGTSGHILRSTLADWVKSEVVGSAAADLVEPAVGRALVAGEPHSHALAPVALASPGPHHLALLAVLEPVAALEGVALPREVDQLSCRVVARQRRWRLAAYLVHPHGTL